MADVRIKVVVPTDFITHELMRFALSEIVRIHEDEPWALSAEDAAEIAKEALDAVERLEDE